jgi:dihydrofolate reductase
MGRIVAAEYLSLDGVMEDPGPAGDFEHRGWTSPYWNDELAEYQSELLFASDALLLGRVTYEEFVASWPLRSGDPFTDKMNSMRKFVVSTTLSDPLEWNAALLQGDVAEEALRLKQQSGQDLLIYGSSTLVNMLMQHHLIDVYRLMLYPLVLGVGRRFFSEGGDKTTLTPTDAKTTSTGVVVLTYEPARNEAGR